MIRFNIIPIGGDINSCKVIRKIVFCDEQGYSEDEEFDELDATSTHILMLDGELPIGTGRIIEEDGYFKLGRIAVLKEYRGKNLGFQLVNEMIRIANNMGATQFKISAQTYAKAFYEKFGFKQIGEEYFEGHVPHIKMVK